MDKYAVYQLWRRVRPLKPWYFLVIAVVAGCLCIWTLRQNSYGMAQLRHEVYQADKDSGNVQLALQHLQLYVTRHMNTDLSTGPNAPYPPVQLLYTYDRAVKAAGDQVTASNSKIYNDAQSYCERQDSKDYYGTNRVPCVQEYVRGHNAAVIPVISDSLYKFDFASPWWSPDVAGWSLMVTVVSLLAFLATWLARRILKRSL